MKRKHVISQVTKEQSSPEVLAARAAHEAKGYRITNMKEILLHSVVAFEALEGGSYAVNEELIKRIGERAKMVFGYVISNGNECVVCGTYFEKLISDLGITDFKNFEFTEEELDLIEFGEAVVADPNHVPDEIYEKIQERYDEETLVLLVTNAVLTLANNYFNNIVGTQLDEYLYAYYKGDVSKLQEK